VIAASIAQRVANDESASVKGCKIKKEATGSGLFS
jgi:hypothetical protein